MTIVIFFVLITSGAIFVTVMPGEVIEEEIALAKEYKTKKNSVMESIKNVKFVNVEDYIKKDHDTVRAINKALQENNHVLFPKTLDLPINGKLVVKSNTIIQFEKGSTLVAGYPDLVSPFEQCLFFLYGVNNVTFLGNDAVIRTAAAQSHVAFPSLCIYGGKKVSIFDLRIYGPTGFGIVVSGFIHSKLPYYCSEDVDLMNVKISEAQQGGLLVESVDRLKVFDFTVSQSSGLSPQAGVTIKPDTEHDCLKDVFIEQLVTWGNAGAGLAIIPGVALEQDMYVIVQNYTSRFDGDYAPIYIMNSGKGKVVLKKLVMEHEEKQAAVFRTWDTKKCETKVFGSKLNCGDSFSYAIADQKDDPFKSDMSNLHVVT